MYEATSSGSNLRSQTSVFLTRSAADRLAVYIVSMIDCEDDPRTVLRWARHANASSSTIREHCRLVQIKAHNARDLGRLLRAICRSGRTWLPESVLDCADLRTLNKLMELGGLTGRRGKLAPSIREFLDGQRWIPQNHPELLALRTLLLQLRLSNWEYDTAVATFAGASARP